MTAGEPHPLESILRLCKAEEPDPWYPSVFARAHNIVRDDLDPHLDRLRLDGFIQLTEWVKDRGQGYVLTAAGQQLLKQPKLLERVLHGEAPRPREEERRPAAGGRLSPRERAEAARAALLSDSPPVVTIILIALNVAVFLAGMVLASRENVLNEYLSGTTDAQRKTYDILGQIGAISGVDVYLRRQWWRLLTCCFVHIGLMHLGVNMYSLFVVGPLLERLWGKGYFLLLYLVAGFGGSCAMVWDSPVSVGAGASGALWGILASMVTWIAFHRRLLPPDLTSAWVGQLVVVFALNIAITLGVPHISRGAHFGGGLVGLVAAVPVVYLRFGRWFERVLAASALVAIPAACVIIMLRGCEAHAGQIRARAAEIEALQADRDAREFNQRLMPGINQAVKKASAEYLNEFLPLLEQRPKRRDPDEVNRVAASLTEAETEVNAEAARLRQSRPFASRRVETVRQVGVEYLQEWGKLLAMSRDALQQGANWPEDDRKAFHEQNERLRLAHRRWDRVLAGNDDADD